MPLMMLWLACVRPAPPPSPDEAAVAAPPILRFPLPGLLDVACATRCVALTRFGYLELPGYTQLPGTPPPGADELVGGAELRVRFPCPEGRCSSALDGSSPRVEPPPPPLVELGLDPLAAAVEAVRTGETWAATHGWRRGFQPLLADASPTILVRNPRSGTLTRAGDPPLFVQLPVAPTTVRWPPVFARHPGKPEVYFLSWPGGALRALDPATLGTRWTVELEGASHGLFVDPGGRFLLVAEGPDRAERYVDWSVWVPAGEPADDPLRDELLRAQDRPPVSAVALVDLERRVVTARAQGHYRRWLPHPDGRRYLLATDREVVFTPPEEPS